MNQFLSIEQLEAVGGLVSEKPEPVDIEWYQVGDDGIRKPATYTVNVLRLPFQTVEDVTRTSKSVTIGLIAAGIVFEGGTRLTLEQAGRLDPKLVNELIQAFNKVNNAGDKKGNA